MQDKQKNRKLIVVFRELKQIFSQVLKTKKNVIAFQKENLLL